MILYLDTSSLAKIYVSEDGSDDVRRMVGRATVVATSRVAYPEMRAALARRRRERTLGPAAFNAAKEALEADWTRYVAVDVTPAICREAGDFAERYRLRGFDSLHLASFASVVRGAAGLTTTFSSFDDHLNRAARTLIRALARDTVRNRK